MKPAPLDSAIAASLNLSPGTATVHPHGGPGFSQTAKITTTSGLTYFLKTGKGASQRLMLEGEYHSLCHLHRLSPTICPRPLSHGPLSSDPETHHITTTFLPEHRGSARSLARKLAELHNNSNNNNNSNNDDGESPGGGAGFGFPVTTCCGVTPQDNTWTATWSEFFAARRLGGILGSCEEAHGEDPELRTLVARVRAEVVPRLVGAVEEKKRGAIEPALVHGDLWNGNVHGDVVFDPSSCYAHAEFEHGIMKMFGGFGRDFWDEYWKVRPKDEPKNEYEDRVELYMLYHRLNHYAVFGGGYRDGAVRSMVGLIGKYGS